MLVFIWGPNLEFLTSINDDLFHAQNGQILAFKFKLTFKFMVNSPQTIGILSKVFYISGPNLMILA